MFPEELIGIAVFFGINYFSNEAFSLVHFTLQKIEEFALGNTREFFQDPNLMIRKLITEAQSNESGSSITHLGYLGGNYAVISPRSQTELVGLINQLDEETSSRKGHTSFKFFSGNDFFIISEIGHGAISLRKNLSRFLTPSKLYTPMIKEIDRAIGSATQIELRHEVCSIVRTVLLDNILGVTQLPGNTYDLMEAYSNDVQRWGTFPFPELLNYIPRLRKKREVYKAFSQEILEPEFNKLIDVLHTENFPENVNLIAAAVVSLFRDENPNLTSEEQYAALKALSHDKIRQYFEKPMVQTLPLLLKAADNLTDAIVICLEKIVADPNKLKMLRDELDNACPEDEPDALTLKALPVLNAFYKESIRFDAPTAVPRYTAKGYKSDALTIPPNTMVIIDLQRLTKGDEYWTNPNQFDPTRFLSPPANNENGKNNLNPNTLGQFPFVPFSVGRRNCPAFAVTEILFKAAIAQFILNYQLQDMKKNESGTVLRISTRERPHQKIFKL